MNKRPDSKRKRRTGITSWISAIVAGLTILSIIASNLNPSKLWISGVLGLLFPYLYLVNLILLVVMISKKRLLLIIPLIAFFSGVNKLPLLIQLDGSNGRPEYVSDVTDEFKLLSFNVRVFDLYNWTRNIDTREKIFVYLEDEAPDILCLQEFYSSDNNEFNNQDLIKKRLQYKFNHIQYSITVRETDHWGIATFSNYPIVNKGVIYFDEHKSNACIYTDILLKKDTVRVFNTHLQSVKFDDNDYRFIESIVGNEEESQKMIRTKAIITRLMQAFKKRGIQASILADHINKSPYPVIICGDFNDTPVSYCYKMISSNLNDAFRESGLGLGSTYSGPIPGLRIDYIMHDKKIHSYDFKVDNVKLSDHYPISCAFTLKQPE